MDTNETGSSVLEHEHEHESEQQPEHEHKSEHQLEHHSITNVDTITEEEEEEEQTEGQSSTSTNQEQADSKSANLEPVNSKSANQDPVDSQSTSQHTENKPSEFKKPEVPDTKYTWRIDLGQTEPYWRGWFEGLSNRFLSCDVPKMLLLAGVDRLDKDLTIGQMQGKFQMQVLPKSGHAVHEDVPEQVAEALATFLTRNRMATATGNFEPVFPGC